MVAGGPYHRRHTCQEHGASALRNALTACNTLVMYTWHTLLHYPHGANAGCDLAGVAPVGHTGPYMTEEWGPEGTFCDTVQVPSRGGDMESI